MPHSLAFGPPKDCSYMTVIDDRVLDLDLLRMQRDQYRHDMRNHFDILALHKHDRLKHYGLHFAKYVGRIARSPMDREVLVRTLVDTMLISLSAANTLHQDVASSKFEYPPDFQGSDPLHFLADAAGRFADACEKIDHLEDFVPMARAANLDILVWVLSSARREGVDIVQQMALRREQLVRRQFFIDL